MHAQMYTYIRMQIHRDPPMLGTLGVHSVSTNCWCGGNDDNHGAANLHAELLEGGHVSSRLTQRAFEVSGRQLLSTFVPWIRSGNIKI